MATLCIFNPEHDLCLANGDRNFVPPQSALAFAREGTVTMRLLYGDDVPVIAADDYELWRRSNAQPDAVVAWGWDMRLKQTLLRQGMSESLMPSDEAVAQIRRLQHRSFLAPLQPHASAATSVDQVAELLERHRHLVLKAPLSGSGRGVRLVSNAFIANDREWIEKTVMAQGCVMVEQRFRVAYDFALEYIVHDGSADLSGLSHFVTQSGVYRFNMLEKDDTIRADSGISEAMEHDITRWINDNVAPLYNGPLGVDLFRTADGVVVVSEMNLRHTMGMVAHSYLAKNPSKEGMRWCPPLGIA